MTFNQYGDRYEAQSVAPASRRVRARPRMTLLLHPIKTVSQLGWRVYSLAHLAIHPHIFFKQLYAIDWYQQTLVDWLTWLNPDTGSRILEVGCSTGEFAAELAQQGFKVTGMDRSARAIQHANRYHRHATLQFEVGDALHLPPSLQDFSYTLAASLLNVVTDPALLLSEMTRVTASHGVVSCLFPTPAMTSAAAHEFIQQQHLRGFAAEVILLWARLAVKLEPSMIIARFTSAQLGNVRNATFLQGMLCGVSGNKR